MPEIPAVRIVTLKSSIWEVCQLQKPQLSSQEQLISHGDAAGVHRQPDVILKAALRAVNVRRH